MLVKAQALDVEILMDLVDLNFADNTFVDGLTRRDPYGSRGSKSEVLAIKDTVDKRRDPYGSRGSKFCLSRQVIHQPTSRSLWISWI